MLNKIKSLISKNTSEHFSSFDYWNARYDTGNNSGSGSYGIISEYKALVVNDFVHTRRINNIIEFGCGDGNQLGLAKYPNYTGLDISKKAITLCKQKFPDDKNKSFFLQTPSSIKKLPPHDLAISLEVIFHLIEDNIFEEYMANLFKYSKKYVIIFSSNHDQVNVVDKNKHIVKHVRHRKFTDYIDSSIANFKLIETKINPHRELSFSDFYVYKKI